MPKKHGPTAETLQARKTFREAVHENLPAGISIDEAKTDIEKRIAGAVIGIENSSKKVMRRVSQLLVAISQSRNQN